MNSIKKNYAYNLLYQVLIILIPLITTPYISRVLGANGIGQYSFAYSVANYFVLFIMLGINNYGNREIAKVRDDKIKLSVTFFGIFYMQLFMGILMNIIYLIYCLLLSENIIISLILGAYVFSGIFDINWFFFGIENFKFTVTRNIVIKVISTICIFCFVKSSDDLVIYCAILSISLLISQLALWPNLRSKLVYVRIKIEDIKKHIKPNLILFLTVIAVSIYKIMDKIMLGFMSPYTEVGFYESSEKILQIPIALVTSLGTVMLPRMSNLYAKDVKNVNKYIYYSLLFAMFISSSFSFGIMSVSKEFVPLFYGSGYETCIYLFLILLPSCIFLAYGNVMRTQFLIPNNMDKIYVNSAFLGALINFVINIMLIGRFGSIGAAIGTFFAELFVCIYQCYMIRKKLPIRKYTIRIIPFILSGIIMFIINYFFSLTGSLLYCLIIKILLGIFIYFFFLLVFYYIFKKILKINILYDTV